MRSVFILRPVLLILVFGALFHLPARAATIEELQASIAARNTDIAKLEKDIAAYQSQLDTLGKQKQSLQGAIQTLDIARKKLSSTIAVTQSQIEATNFHIDELGIQIADTSNHIQVSSEAIAASLRELNAEEGNPPITLILGGATLSDLWEQVAAVDQFEGSLRDHVTTLVADKTDLEANKAESESEKQKLIRLNNDLTTQKKALDANRQEKNNLLVQTKDQESNYQKLLAQKVALRQQFEQEITNYESQLKLAVDSSALPKTGSGILHWPLDSVFITQYFGNTDFATKNPQIYNGAGHNGIDLRAAPGTPIKAALDGVVQGTGDTDLTCPNASYGRWVLVRHNDGLSTLYAHLSVIGVSQGQSVNTGQVLGYSGSTGYATGPHLHFTVYATQGVKIAQLPSRALACKGKIYTLPVADLKAYLNPLSYL